MAPDGGEVQIDRRTINADRNHGSDPSLDEADPLWPASQHGAHKAAIEKFVHGNGLGEGYPTCTLRPTGVYGIARPVEASKWFDLVRAVVHVQTMDHRRGGKEVHAADAAKSVGLLLDCPDVAGEAYNCYDRFVSQFDMARIAQRLSRGRGEIVGRQTSPKRQIETGKIRALDMEFGGDALLEQTIAELVAAAQAWIIV